MSIPAPWVPLVETLLFLGITIGWRVSLQLRRHGATGLALFRSARALHFLRDAALCAVPPLIVALAAAPLASPAAAVRLPGRIGSLDRPDVQRAGVMVCSIALVLLVAAQVWMGRSWRIGIDESSRPGLVTGGPFRFCRNPIFLCMLVWFAGFALLLPSWTSVAALAVCFVGTELQVRAEEAYLLRTYGDAYASYAARVGRFLPGIGRLRPRSGPGR
jgi:protein-S-isoprenylcysteine O-methyltransferase Ste14